MLPCRPSSSSQTLAEKQMFFFKHMFIYFHRPLRYYAQAQCLWWCEPWSVHGAPLIEILVARIRQVEFNSYSANLWSMCCEETFVFMTYRRMGSVVSWLKVRLCVVCVAQRLLSSQHDDGGCNYYDNLLAMILLSAGGSGWDCS